MASLSAWFVCAEPDLMVSDVSVEVALLARLHGIPVVSVALPGDRSDPAHRLGYGISTELIGCWPPEAAGVVHGLATRDSDRVQMVGGLSRFPVREEETRRPGVPRVTVLMGAGGSGLTADQLDRARSETLGWEWSVLGGEIGDWHDNVFERLCDADVVVTHAGQNALAEVAAARRPAVVIPERRPHGEQVASACVLRDGAWPVLVRMRWPEGHWASLLDRARRLDGEDWATWCDGLAATRFADVLRTAVAAEPSGVA